MEEYISIMKKKRNLFIQCIKSTVQDEAGFLSSKRIVGLLTALVLNIVILIQAINPTPRSISPEVVHALEYVTIGCLALTSLDKYVFYRNIGNSSPFGGCNPPEIDPTAPPEPISQN